MSPEISVLMPCYNGRRWLKAAIEGILVQTFKDFEFIIVDDGSKDNSLEIIKDYAARDSRIIVASKRNTGLADSLNFGLSLAKGVWIARMDCDDLCSPIRLQKQLDFVRARPSIILLGSGCTEINENGKVLKEYHYPPEHSALVDSMKRLKGFFPHSSAFYLADAAKKAGGYNPRFARAEDRHLWLELSRKGEIACLAETLIRVRIHPGQISHDSNGSRQFCDLIATTVCYLLVKKGHSDPSVSPDKEMWINFLAWIEHKISLYGASASHDAWRDARNVFLCTKNRILAVLKCSCILLMSGYASQLFYEKIFGCRLPERLADEWVELTENSRKV